MKKRRIKLKTIIACEYSKAVLTQSYDGWEIATSRGSRRCRTRQEAYTFLQGFMRRADVRKIKRRNRK